MKRSTMLKKIEKYLVKNIAVHRGTKSKLANDLLKLIEKNGMLPPKYYYIIKGKAHQFGSGVTFEWESEDEA